MSDRFKIGEAKMTSTKTDTAVSTPLATLPAVQLHRVLSDAAVFASHDQDIPSICQVHVEFTGDHMLAVATDRFRLGVSKIGPVDGTTIAGSVDADAQFNLALRDVQTLIKLAKTLRRDERTRFVWINSALPPSDEYGTGTVTFKFSDGASLDVTPQDAEFPRWRQLFPETGSQVPRDATAFTAEYLASFGKVDGGFSQRLVMYSHDNQHGYDEKTLKNQQPSTFTIGDDFVGLLMPVRLVDDVQRTWVKPDWMN